MALLLMFLAVFLAHGYSSPIIKDLENKNISRLVEDPMPSTKPAEVPSGLSSDCESLCKVCNATGKLGKDGSCTCFSDNGGEVSCLKERTGQGEDSTRGLRCTAMLGSADRSSLQDTMGAGLLDLTPVERAEEFRKRVEALRTATMTNLRKAFEKTPTVQVEPVKGPAVETKSLQKALLIEALPELKTPIVEVPPAIKLPALTLPTVLKTPAMKTLPSIETPFTQIAGLPKTSINIPSVPLKKTPALVLGVKLPSASKSQLPSLPFLEKTPEIEVSEKALGEVQQNNDEIPIFREDKILESPFPSVVAPKTGVMLPTRASVNFNLPSLTSVPIIRIPSTQKVQYLSTPHLSLGIPHLPQSFPLHQLGGPVIFNGYGRVLRSSGPSNFVEKPVAQNHTIKDSVSSSSNYSSHAVAYQDKASLPAENHTFHFEIPETKSRFNSGKFSINHSMIESQFSSPKTPYETFSKANGHLEKVEEAMHSSELGKEVGFISQGLIKLPSI